MLSIQLRILCTCVYITVHTCVCVVYLCVSLCVYITMFVYVTAYVYIYMVILSISIHDIYFTAVDDFDNRIATVTANPGETMVTMSIAIINDDLLESTEVFDVVIEIGGTDTDGAAVGQPGVALVTIISEDG